MSANKIIFFLTKKRTHPDNDTFQLPKNQSRRLILTITFNRGNFQNTNKKIIHYEKKTFNYRINGPEPDFLFK
jgi:hypothetical protein